jgi:methyl-accepting chemotaxis protein
MNNNSTKVIDEEASKYLELLAIKTGRDIEKIMNEIEIKVDTFALVIANSVDMNEIDKEDDAGYFKSIFPMLENEVLKFANSFEDNYDFYVTFNTELTEDIEEILYVRDEDTKEYFQIPEVLTLEDMVESNEMLWYFGPINEKRGLWTEPYDDLFLERRLMTYSTPVLIDGTAIAVVGIDIEFTQFEELVNSIEVYDTGYAFLFDEEYHYLVHPLFKSHEDLMTVEDGQYAYMRELFDQGQTGIIKYEFFDQDKILGYYHLNNGWVVAMAPPYREAFKNVDQLRQSNIVVVLIGIGIAVVIMFVISHKFTHPIQELTKEIAVMGEGRLDASVSVHALNNRTEIGMLANSVESMRLALNEAFENIREQNETLEHRVEERTQELYALNQELVASMEALENMQAKYLISEKNALVRSMVSNIAHRMNTPIGTSITMISFLKGIDVKMDDTSKAQYEKSLELLIESQSEMKDVIEQMRYYLTTYDHIEMNEFDLERALNIVARTDVYNSPAYNMSITINYAGFNNITQSQKLITQLFRQLIDYSKKIRSSQEENEIILHVTVDYENIELIYCDQEFKMIEDASKMFDPYHMHSFSKGTMGLDLNLIGDLVTRGLSGEVTVRTTSECKNAIVITIPYKQT